MLSGRGYYRSMDRKNSILIPIRFASKHELHELVCGAVFCPACDCQVMGANIMNKMPLVNNYNSLEGWVCGLCDSVFDLQDKMVDIGEFDLYDKKIAEA